MTGAQRVVLRIIIRKENGNPRNQQRARQTIHDGIQQGSQIGLAAQAAAEINQRLAIV